MKQIPAAQRNLAAESVTARHVAAQRKADIDWDAAIARLRDMLERIDHHHQERQP
jgi:hypothetical protein